MRARIRRSAPPNGDIYTAHGGRGRGLSRRVTVTVVVGTLALSVAVHARGENRGAVTVASAATSTAAQTEAGRAPDTTSTTARATGASRAFCDLLRSYSEDVRRISISLTDPAALRPLLDRALPAIAESESLATARATSDVAALRSSLTDLKGGFEASGYELAKLPPETALRLMSPEFMGSFARLQALLSEGC